jgi:hypothetical protein
LQIAKQSAQWYNGYDVLLNPAIDLFADAWYEPKMVAVPIILSKQEILNNEGEAQVMAVMDSYMAAAERALEDAMDGALHAAGGGKQLTGLQTAVPTVNTTGVYGGIDRGQNVWWQTQLFDVQTYMAGVTQVTSTTIRPLLNRVMTAQSRGKDYADIILMSKEHYEAYDAATIAIQRQTNDSGLGKLGFSTLEYIGGGKRSTIVLDGGLGSDMPANTTYGLQTDSLRLRYHPNRNFDSIFKGEGMMPIDKDAVAQFIGWMGELTMTNPKFNWKIIDSNPAA